MFVKICASHSSVFLPFTAHAGNADMIQPGLIPLQPNLDFMDSFDPLQGSSMALPVAAVVLCTNTNEAQITTVVPKTFLLGSTFCG